MAVIGFTLYAGIQLAQATSTLQRLSHEHSLIESAYAAIVSEQVALQRCQAAPTRDTCEQFTDAARRVGGALRDAAEAGGRIGSDARRLAAEQTAYQKQAELVVEAVTSTGSGRQPAERAQVLPAYQTLIRDVIVVSGVSARAVEDEAAAVRGAKSRLFVGAAIGLALGIGLFVIFWRAVLAYRRMLTVRGEAAQAKSKLLDPLTGLPNQTLFSEMLRKGVEEAARTGSRGVSVLVISLTGLKAIRDTHGPESADQLLVAASRRLRGVIRDIDTVARLGGSDLGVLLRDLADVQSVRVVTERIEQVLRRNFRLHTGGASVSPCVGVAIGAITAGDAAGPAEATSYGEAAGPGGVLGQDPDQLIRRADVAMCRARSAGGGVAISDVDAASEMALRTELPGDLRALLQSGDPDGQFRFSFQPVVRLADATITAVEATARWNHPAYGLLTLDEYGPIAEAHGLDTPLMSHLLSALAGQVAAWQEAGTPLVVSMNVTPRSLLDPWFAPAVRAATERAGLDPEWLRVEIGEAGLIAESGAAVATLRDLREQGVPVTIDGCTPGLRALARLKQLPADEVKISQELIGELGVRAEGRPEVRETIEMGHNLGLAVVADGVADVAALAVVLRLGCDRAQGVVLSESVEAANAPAACERARGQAWGALMREEMCPRSGLDEVRA